MTQYNAKYIFIQQNQGCIYTKGIIGNLGKKIVSMMNKMKNIL